MIDVRTVPFSVTEADFLITEMINRIHDLMEKQKLNQLTPREEENLFKAINIRKKLEIMFEDELRK